ncbi:uncharacterized protein LOC123315617 [Coccinella septempunctata]|uniref:uncharacterized protein LOC123315617 n=1 Tax=Coccinella septempunctata TaxID=41139 RepID=UPI001D088B6E|nr:uncharacterized protein LOC123315617 [Coccinella septempunctata]
MWIKILWDPPTPSTYFIPHHCVLKPESVTTKLCVVFDASQKAANGFCLNDTLLLGPKLHQDVSCVLSRFRLHSVCFTADIRQMFRQVLVAREHQDFQRILWPFPSEPIKEFRLRTLVFGIRSSPFLAMRCIRQLDKEHSYEFPEACAVLQDDIFVDDIVSGSDSFSGAIQLQTQLTEVLSRAGLELQRCLTI